MRSSAARRWDVPLIVDVAIALALVSTVTFFIIVMEYHVGAGELTHAQLLLLSAKKRTPHTSALIRNDNKRQ